VIFFTGMHQPSDAGCVPAAMVSIARLWGRRSAFPGRRILIDSGAFSELLLHGRHTRSVTEYAAALRLIRGWLGTRLLAAVAQDYMCEPAMLARTGMTIADHQRLTIERYDALLAADPGVRIMPVLQGYAPADYVTHLRGYGARLRPRMWVGVGSVCKRNGKPAAIEAVLAAIKRERPDLRLHGFGVKKTALGSGMVRDLLFSADSMAWSFAGRYTGRGANDPANAVRFARGIATMPVQEVFAEFHT
jgi:hypothetical protein